MKILKFLCCLIGLVMMGSCSLEPKVPDGEFLIEGCLKNVENGTVIKLLCSEGTFEKLVMCDTVINGEFSFRDTITTGVRKFTIGSSSNGFPSTLLSVWIASGTKTSIIGEDRLIRTWRVQNDLLEQREQNKLDEAVREEWQKLAPLMIKEDSLKLEANKYSKGDVKKKELRIEYDSIQVLQKAIKAEMYQKTLAALKDLPITSIWMKAFIPYARFLQDKSGSPMAQEVHALFNRLSEADKQTELGKAILEYVNLPTPVKEGDDMADGDLYDTEGHLHHLSEFKGKYILLDFWSQACGPCFASLPEMEEIMELYKGRMEVVSICVDPEPLWKSFVAEKQMKGNQWNEKRKSNTGLMVAYQVNGIPAYVMISPEGKIMKMWSGYGKGSLKKRIKELIL